MSASDLIVVTYVVETAGDPEAIAARIASDQSTGTFVELAGETEELKARVAARVLSVHPLEPADRPSFPGVEGPVRRARARVGYPPPPLRKDL